MTEAQTLEVPYEAMGPYADCLMNQTVLADDLADVLFWPERRTVRVVNIAPHPDHALVEIVTTERC